MNEISRCVMCETDEGKPHPVSGKHLERFVANNNRTSHICFECLTRCAAIMAAEELSELGDDLSVKDVHEPRVYAEEYIPPKSSTPIA
ncbi:hypothetical protein AMC90_PC00294 (plasmid) [Rhizobium phaseoli]|nr:hypothetical protein AMC90_PC00294 [Rhizobium phaseoli]